MRPTLAKLKILLVMVLTAMLASASSSDKHGLPSRVAANGDAQLGDVEFSVSCTPEAQSRFKRGITLLHSFQYSQSRAAFAGALSEDVSCAMALWGMAMSVYHQLWAWPSESVLREGREYLQKAKALGAKTERERAYIDALGAFYSDQTDLERNKRAAAYVNAMRDLQTRYPEDHEARAFYALALVAMPASQAEELANRKNAIAILQKLMTTNPNHPGVAHYLIHASDSPALAEVGLTAARRYSQIAPDSSHALHMPSHTFTRLGLWRESVASNIASARAAAAATRAGLADESSYELHACLYLHYAYLQSGLTDQANQIARNLDKIEKLRHDDMLSYRALFEARTVMETGNWKEAAKIAAPSVAQPQDRFTVAWARTIGLARTGDLDGARSALRELSVLAQASRAGATGLGEKWSVGSSAQSNGTEDTVEEIEAKAWIAFAEQDLPKALSLLRKAAELEDGRSEVMFGMQMSAREMLGDVLLQSNHPADALQEFERVLTKSPNRFNSLYGAAKSAWAAGKDDEAEKYYAALRGIAGDGAARPELRLLAQIQGKRAK